MTDGFVERRRHRIGASDVAAALTGAFDQSPASIITQKLGLLDQKPVTAAMQRGLELESRVIDAAASLLDLDVVGRQHEAHHPALSGFVATLDALVVVAGVGFVPLEVKTTNGDYPLDYVEAQVHAQMACVGAVRGLSAVWNPNVGTLTVREHLRDPAVAQAVYRMARFLWNHLEAGTVPPPTFGADSSLMNRLHPQSTPGSVDLDAELVAELRDADTGARAAKERLELVQARVKEQLGDYDLGAVDGEPVVRWRTVTERRVDFGALQADHSDLLNEYRQTSSVRRFTLVSPTRTTTNRKKVTQP